MPLTPEQLMQRAAALSIENVRLGRGGPFAAVIARGGEVVAEGTNLVPSTKDVTAHAEITAIRAACKALDNFDLSGCEIFTSCEPCPMCLGAIYWARLDRIWYALSRDDAARFDFRDAFIYDEISLPRVFRKLPIAQLAAPDATFAFEEWMRSPLRIAY